MSAKVLHGKCEEVLPTLPDCSVDSVVTDPPYELGFMGKGWDSTGIAYSVDMWAEVLRVLKPGGHLLSFGGTRTWHRMAVAIEDAGFEIRDSIAWMYGSGFPKSLDVSKAIDKAARGVPQGGADPTSPHHGKYRTTTTEGKRWDGDSGQGYGAGGSRFLVDGAASGSATGLAESGAAGIAPDAARWEGWGTALKPAHEPVVWGVKPVTACGMLSVIGSHLDRLEEACRPSASDAGPSSAHTRADSPEARTTTAPEPVATPHEDEPARPTPTGAAAGSSEATATSVFEWTGETFWNTVTSWRECWAELCEATSTSTTSTATSRTTDLQTLSSCLSQITQSVTATSTPEPDSLRSLVTVADNLFAAGVLNSRSTLALSAIESATSATPPDSQDAGGSSPAFEPVVVARKPLQGTVAANVLAWGTGALNIDATRVNSHSGGPGTTPRSSVDGRRESMAGAMDRVEYDGSKGRWPANVILDESQAAALDEMSGERTSGLFKPEHADNGKDAGTYGAMGGRERATATYGDTGGASRFFYVAKAPKSERPKVNGVAHPTVKPLTLIRYLVRLVTPPGGTVLDMFAGSGTTGEAAILEGFNAILIEREADHLPLIHHRLTRANDALGLFGEETA